MKMRQLITLTGIVAFSGGVIFPTQAEELTETSHTSEDEMVIQNAQTVLISTNYLTII